MPALTIGELHSLLVECAGDTETAGSPAEIIDLPFEDLGYDSLALIETAARIKRETGVEIADDEVANLRTPREMLDAVNSIAGSSRPA